MATISKKAWPEMFNQILSGKKKFDVRLADFDIQEGDTLVLEEWNNEKKEYTGRRVEVTVTYILKTKDKRFWSKDDIEKHGLQVIQFEPKKR